MGVTFPNGNLITNIGHKRGGARVDDNELMFQVRAGNKEAYEILMKKYMSQAKTFAYKYVHDSFAAEDIVQESFVDIYIQRFSFDQRFKFSTYLYTIIKNKSINYLKKNRELPLSSFDEETEVPVLEQTLTDFNTPESEYLKKTEFREQMSAIQRLNEDEKNMLYLYAVEERSYKEIASKLGITVMKVKIKIFRARKKLREGREKQ